MAPSFAIAFTVIIQVSGVVITSSPDLIPKAFKHKYNALLPESKPTAYFLSINLDIFSNFCTSGPKKIDHDLKVY